MLRPARPRCVRAPRSLIGITAAAGLLAAAGAASAAPSIGGPNGWTNSPVYPVTQVAPVSGSPTFTWTAGPAGGTLAWGQSINLNGLPDGSYTINVQDPPFSASKPIGIDRVNPAAVLNLVPAATTVQFGATKSITYSCNGGPSGLAAGGCIATIGGTPYASGSQVPTNSLGTKTVTLNAKDGAGNTTVVTKAYTVVDTIAPSAPGLVAPLEPTGDATPTFQWLGATDTGSGIDKYTLTVVNGSGATVINQDVNAPGVSYTPSSPLANGAYTWVVAAVDNAGNSTSSATGAFIVDNAAPSPPAITNGPGDATGAHTSDTTPSFTIAGPGPGFAWEVVDEGGDTVDAGILTAPGTITTNALPEGAYSLRAVQVSATGNISPEAVYVFTVDTTAPTGVNLWGRPVSPGTRPNPVFSWTGPEADINYSWNVSQGGKVVQGPVVTPGGQANLAPLAAGAYQFSVTPVDLAANSGPTMKVPFVINDVPAPPKPKVAVKGKNKKKSLVIRTRNVKKLAPRVGRTLTSRRPLLKWKKTTRDTVLYNLQIFAVKGNKLVKVYSAFPNGTRFRVPNRRLGFGQTYVWQVFAYRGPVKGYLPKPIGISWFKTKKKAPNRLLLPKAKKAKAGKQLTVRWKKAGKARYYRVDLVRGSKRVWAKRTRGRTVRVPAAKLKAAGTYKLIVRRGTAPRANGRAYAKKAWVGTKLKVSR